MSSSDASVLSNESRRKALIRISQFVLREETEEIRDDLQENIIEMALFWGAQSDQFVSRDEVKGLIPKEMYIIDFPELIFDTILSRLITKGSVELNEGGCFHLTGIRRHEIQQYLIKKEETVSKINERFVQKLEKEYEKQLFKEQKQEALERFYSFLASLVMEKTDLVARIIARKNIDTIPTEMPIQLLAKILSVIPEKKLMEAEWKTIVTVFREASEDFCSFLYSVTQNLVCINILNFDPDCQSLEKEAFSTKTLFLDTNVLIALLCPTQWMHKVAENVVSLSQLLGAKCIVTKRTYQEYLVMLEEANSIYMKWKAPYRLFENADNEFLSSFWFEKKTTPSQSWRGYYYRMKQIESVLKKLKIDYYTNPSDEVTKSPEYEFVKNAVNKCYQSVKRKKKSLKVREHDAFHMLLIRELREKDEKPLLGPNQWFVTGDESLLCVDNKINSLSAYLDKDPSSMICDLWLEMIMPFLPLNIRESDAYETFSILVKNKFAIIPFEIDTDTLLEIQGSWMKYDWLEAEDIARIQNEEWVKQYVQKVRRARVVGVSTEKMEGLAKVFADKLEQQLNKVKDEKFEQLSKKIDNLTEEQQTLATTLQEQQQTITQQQQTINTQQEELERKQETIQGQTRELKTETDFKRMMRKLSAIAGIFLIGSPPLLIVLKILSMDLPSVGYCAGSFIVGAILVFFAIAYEKAKVSLEARLDVSHKEGS